MISSTFIQQLSSWMVGIIQKKYGHIDFLQSKKTKQLGVWAPENFLFFGEKMEEKKPAFSGVKVQQKIIQQLSFLNF